MTVHDELRGDVGARGFWKRGVESIFDVRIVDTDCKSHMKTAPDKVLARQEKQKKVENVLKISSSPINRHF